jgi:hypothetical protein
MPEACRSAGVAESITPGTSSGSFPESRVSLRERGRSVDARPPPPTQQRFIVAPAFGSRVVAASEGDSVMPSCPRVRQALRVTTEDLEGWRRRFGARSSTPIAVCGSEGSTRRSLRARAAAACCVLPKRGAGTNPSNRAARPGARCGQSGTGDAGQRDSCRGAERSTSAARSNTTISGATPRSPRAATALSIRSFTARYPRVGADGSRTARVRGGTGPDAQTATRVRQREADARRPTEVSRTLRDHQAD